MLSAGGLSGIRVALVDSLGIKDGPIKWDGISLINNLQYAGQRITVWRSYDIGSGKIIDTQLPKGRRIQIMNVFDMFRGRSNLKPHPPNYISVQCRGFFQNVLQVPLPMLHVSLIADS